ncbi:hypothetical protein EJ06DRAFT_392697 [Trichodelitschia bisporula]|uniref:Uncharacterized protein n=1 Tax=Trichodelitschia bisporula TaxID=703511 RepID=A0A6G1I045_9PEZI|nr:hypothetical protein EJ06DRAFT_392697 [Trichodelitschia bisporula]
MNAWATARVATFVCRVGMCRSASEADGTACILGGIDRLARQAFVRDTRAGRLSRGFRRNSKSIQIVIQVHLTHGVIHDTCWRTVNTCKGLQGTASSNSPNAMPHQSVINQAFTTCSLAALLHLINDVPSFKRPS